LGQIEEAVEGIKGETNFIKKKTFEGKTVKKRIQNA
jgi:hypothetical protein